MSVRLSNAVMENQRKAREEAPAAEKSKKTAPKKGKKAKAGGAS